MCKCKSEDESIVEQAGLDSYAVLSALLKLWEAERRIMLDCFYKALENYDLEG